LPPVLETVPPENTQVTHRTKTAGPKSCDHNSTKSEPIWSKPAALEPQSNYLQLRTNYPSQPTEALGDKGLRSSRRSVQNRDKYRQQPPNTTSAGPRSCTHNSANPKPNWPKPGSLEPPSNSLQPRTNHQPRPPEALGDKGLRSSRRYPQHSLSLHSYKCRPINVKLTTKISQRVLNRFTSGKRLQVHTTNYYNKTVSNTTV
jgi:hypothetical protein